jgi:hypothetical protein
MPKPDDLVFTLIAGFDIITVPPKTMTAKKRRLGIGVESRQQRKTVLCKVEMYV